MNVHERILNLMRERGWTQYQLSKRSGIPSSTLTNMFKRSTSPTLATIETLCDCMGITLSQFFADGKVIPLSAEEKEMFTKWVNLTKEQKKIISELINNII